MHRDPQYIVESNLSGSAEYIDAIVKPNITLGYRLAKPPATPFTHGIILFGVTLNCSIVYSPTTEYKCKIVSITEIITKNYDIPFWGLESISNNEIKAIEKKLIADMGTKGLKFPYELEFTQYSDLAKKYLKIEFDKFSSQL